MLKINLNEKISFFKSFFFTSKNNNNSLHFDCYIIKLIIHIIILNLFKKQ